VKYLVPKSRMREIRTYGSVVGPARETGSAYPIDRAYRALYVKS